jgi:hypothetical protein
VVEEGPTTVIESAPDAGVVALVSLIVSGTHDSHGRAEQVMVTVPVNPTGVRVTVEDPVPPAVIVVLEPESEKVGCTTRTVVFWPELNGA